MLASDYFNLSTTPVYLPHVIRKDDQTLMVIKDSRLAIEAPGASIGVGTRLSCGGCDVRVFVAQ